MNKGIAIAGAIALGALLIYKNKAAGSVAPAAYQKPLETKVTVLPTGQAVVTTNRPPTVPEAAALVSEILTTTPEVKTVTIPTGPAGVQVSYDASIVEAAAMQGQTPAEFIVQSTLPSAAGVDWAAVAAARAAEGMTSNGGAAVIINAIASGQSDDVIAVAARTGISDYGYIAENMAFYKAHGVI